jgi:5'-nucleotidase / UDP-sugar diphosphatase
MNGRYGTEKQEFTMNKAIGMGMLVLAMAGGCSSAKKSTASSVTEPLSPAPVAYQPAPQPYTPSPVSAQPVTYDSAPAPVIQAASATPTTPAGIGSGNYTVKRGDTLYSIAKSHYGTGSQYTKIISANPGLTPQTLKAGQTITIP